MENKVFLGGTCNNSTWRNDLIPNLKVNYFNPMVKDWNEACQIEEYKQKDNCNIHLYIITSDMTGVFSIAEIIDSVHTKDKTTILQVIPYNFTYSQLKSLKAVIKLVKLRGGIAHIEYDMSKTIDIINNFK